MTLHLIDDEFCDLNSYSGNLNFHKNQLENKHERKKCVAILYFMCVSYYFFGIGICQEIIDREP